MKIGKYEFVSHEQALEKIKKLGVEVDDDGNEIPTHEHTIIELGHVVVEQGVLNEKDEVVKEGEISEKYYVDVIWKDLEDHPYGWKSYAVTPSDNLLHEFWGIDYLENKM